MAGWPKVLPNDDGIRPAGPPDECFYCGMKVGQEHSRECVTIERLVRIEFRVHLDVAVPHFWTEEMIDFRFNESTWCANSLVDMIQEAYEQAKEEGGCLCNLVTAEYGGDIDITPIQKTREDDDGSESADETWRTN